MKLKIYGWGYNWIIYIENEVLKIYFFWSTNFKLISIQNLCEISINETIFWIK